MSHTYESSITPFFVRKLGQAVFRACMSHINLAIYEIMCLEIILLIAIKKILIIPQMMKNFIKFLFNIFSWFLKIFARLQQF